MTYGNINEEMVSSLREMAVSYKEGFDYCHSKLKEGVDEKKLEEDEDEAALIERVKIAEEADTDQQKMNSFCENSIRHFRKARVAARAYLID